jgi:DNA ligase-1
MNFLRPMLAASLLKPTDKHDDETIFNAMKKLRYPVLVSLKMDGIRAIKTDNLVSRTLKPIPNNSIRQRAMKLPAGMDMELWCPTLRYDEIESIVMSREHEASDLINFNILDYWKSDRTYPERLDILHKLIHNLDTEVHKPWTFLCSCADSLFQFEHKAITNLGEGICFRTLNSPYKQGRSTLKEQYLVKLARYVRTECTIVGFEEQLMNTNKSKHNAIGMMDRSSAKSGMLGKGVLGAFKVVNNNGIEFTVGSGAGLTDKIRETVWQEQENWLGKTIVVKHKPHGEKLKPRSPIYMGLRNEIDL